MRGGFVVFIIGLIVVLIIVGVIVASVIRSDDVFAATAPCADFANRYIRNVPVRCFEYYGITEVKH